MAADRWEELAPSYLLDPADLEGFSQRPNCSRSKSKSTGFVTVTTSPQDALLVGRAAPQRGARPGGPRPPGSLPGGTPVHSWISLAGMARI